MNTGLVGHPAALRSAGPGADRITRALRGPAASMPIRPDTALRLPLSCPPRVRAPAAAAILLHAALLAAAVSVTFGVPAEPPSTVAVPLLFVPSPLPTPAVEAPGAPTDATPAVPPAAAVPSTSPARSEPPPPPSAPPITATTPPPAPAAPAEITPPPPTQVPPPTLTAPPGALPPPAQVVPPSPARAEPAPRRPAEAAPRHAAAPPAPRPASHHLPERQSTRSAPPPPASPPALASAAPMPASPAPVAASGPLLPPRPVAGTAGNRPPAYPGPARERGEEGTVVVRVQVTAEGAAAGVSLGRSSGHPALDAAALAAIRAWRFNPATRGGVPVAAEAVVPVAFRLDD